MRTNHVHRLIDERRIPKMPAFLVRMIDEAPSVAALRTMNDDDLDDLERVAQGIAASVRTETRRRMGWRTRPWMRRGAPQPELSSHDYYFDHGYTLVGRKGEKVWVGEPYGVGESAFPVFARWVAAGWHVSIRAWGAIHFPGHTLRVNVWKDELHTSEPEP